MVIEGACKKMGLAEKTYNIIIIILSVIVVLLMGLNSLGGRNDIANNITDSKGVSNEWTKT